MPATLQWFERHARSFDRVYARPRVASALLRAGPARGLALAAATVRAHPGASVLDVGCGPGRVAEAVLEAGAQSYVGIDYSPRMLGLARARLAGAANVRLVEADFLSLAFDRPFDIVLALGLFDYVEDDARVSRWLNAHCASTLLASFTRRDRLKAPLRNARYAYAGCRVFDHDEREVESVLIAAGFATVEVVYRTGRGFFMRAEP